MFRAPRRDAIIALLICSALAGMFAWLSYTAVLTKSATLDEPLHTASAYAATYLHDYRLDVENPPLWKYWAMLPQTRAALKPDYDDPIYASGLSTTDRALWFCDS